MPDQRSFALMQQMRGLVSDETTGKPDTGIVADVGLNSVSVRLDQGHLLTDLPVVGGAGNVQSGDTAYLAWFGDGSVVVLSTRSFSEGQPSTAADVDLSGYATLAEMYAALAGKADVHTHDFLYLYKIIRVTPGSQVQYVYSDTALATAISEASSGDEILLPPRVISGNVTAKAGVALTGLSRNNTILTGLLTGAADARLENFSLWRTANDGSDLKGLIAPASGECVLYNCNILVSQAGAGKAYGIYASAGGNLTFRHCNVTGNSASGSGYGVGVSIGSLKLYHSELNGSTDRIAYL